MDAALALGGASPASATRVGPVGDPGGARPAADRWVAVVDKRVHEQVVGGDVLVDLLPRPLDDRVDLHHLASGVPLDDLRIAASLGLFTADTGKPGVVWAERFFKRHDLPQVAAQVGVPAV